MNQVSNERHFQINCHLLKSVSLPKFRKKMCRMEVCCFYLPLKEGCILASVIEFMVAVLETSFYFIFIDDYHEDEKALWVAEICNIHMCSILLFFGALKEERVCIILHCLFLAIILAAEAIFQSIAFNFVFFHRSPDWLIAYSIAYHSFLLYMIFVSAAFAAELREKNYSDTNETSNDRRPHRLMSSVISSEIYGM